MIPDQAAAPSLLRSPPSGDGGVAADPADLPRSLGDYRLDRELGRGGAGIVYEAEQLSTGRRVALKLPVRTEAPNEEALARFRREGLAAASIDHPNCVFVIDADECEGQPYIAMDLMECGTLQDLVEQVGPLEPARAVHLILQVLDGLQAASRVGLIHRDVKPSNCFLDADGTVKVGDFGLCRALDGPNDLTRSAKLLGTPLYVAPEQVQGLRLDARSDQYSLGGTLFFLLTGRAPVGGEHIGMVLSRILRGETRRVRDFQPKIPEGLDRIVTRCLACKPGRRYPTHAALRRALRTYAPRPVSFAPITRRVAAALADGGCIGLLTLPFLAIASAWSVLPLMVLAYASVCEAVAGRTVGQRLAALRLVTPRGLPPTAWRRLLRNLILGVAILAGALAGAGPSAWTGVLGALGAVAVLGLPAVRRRDRAGVHDLASGTRVVRGPPRRRPKARAHTTSARSRIAGPDQPQLTAWDPSRSRVGPFEIRGQIGEGRVGTLLLAERPPSARPVWVRVSRQQAAAPSPSRRAVRRATRVRWLCGGEEEGCRWDAFAPPRGAPWIDVVRDHGPWTWARAARPLLSLARELRDAQADGSLPIDPRLDEIWLDASARAVCLVDLGPGRDDRVLLEGGEPAIDRVGGACRLLALAARSLVGAAVPAAARDLLVDLERGAPPPGGLAEVVSRLLVWRSA